MGPDDPSLIIISTSQAKAVDDAGKNSVIQLRLEAHDPMTQNMAMVR